MTQHHQFHEKMQQHEEHKKSQQKSARQVWRKKAGVEVGGRNVKRQDNQNWWKKDTRHQTMKIIYHRKNNVAETCYNAPEEEMNKLKNAFVGTVKTPGSTYAVQEWFNRQGFFSVKITPLGANKVLLEEVEEGVLELLMNEYKEWLLEKFDDVKSWSPEIIDNERVVWVRCHGIPVHAWNEDFFASLARNFGEYLGVDEETRTKSSMDVARIRLRSNGYDVFNCVVTANINGSPFHIKVIEEWCGPLHWIDNCCKKCCKKYDDSGGSSDADESDDGGPPLFTVEEEWCSNGEEEGVDSEEEDDAGGVFPENEKERVKEFDDISLVQETVDTHVESRRNDCGKFGEGEVNDDEKLGEGTLNINDDGKETACVGREGDQKLSNENLSGERGGAQPVVVTSVQNMAENCENVKEVCEGASSSNKVGCEEQRVDVGCEQGDIQQEGGGVKKSSPEKTKKKKKRVGPIKKKRRSTKKIRKAPEAQVSSTQPSIPKNLSLHRTINLNQGVVRSSYSKFKPTSSSSSSHRLGGSISQVESI